MEVITAVIVMTVTVETNLYNINNIYWEEKNLTDNVHINFT